MAEGYQTDDEQIEVLKKWWSDNGTFLLVIITIAVISVLGWQGWQKQQQQDMGTASSIYQNMIIAAQGNNGILTAEQRTTASHLANTLKTEYSDSTYAKFGALYIAKFAVEANNFSEAEVALQWILDSGAEEDIKLQAELRLARVFYAQDKYTEALEQLEGSSSVYAAAYEEVRGDILNAQGDYKGASLSYQKAVELNQQLDSPPNNPLLNLKVQQLESKLSNQSLSSDEDV
ncbi:MAG: putative negative regulator of RcsB-dependent stress response [Gammaproteobacteria bacterium]|jgi:predicted negative regulator of RcsB-dependent stress response